MAIRAEYGKQSVGYSLIESKTIDVDGISTRYFDFGKGDTIVLIHGGHYGMYYDSYSWSLNWSDLSRNFRVIAFDRLGMGFTDNPIKDEDHTITASVTHAKKFFDMLALDKVNLVGHSRGAYVAARIALDRKNATKSLVILDSNTLSTYDPNYEAGNRFYDKLEEREPGTETRESVIAEPVANSYSKDHITEDFIDELLTVTSLPKTILLKKRMKILYKKIFFPEVEARKAEITKSIAEGDLKLPALIVWGLNDPSAPVKRGWDLFEAISRHESRSQFHVFNGAGHYSFREHAKEFNYLLSSFVESNVDERW
jgi:2-hydroxy-6-oxonona-2,4-dienedioate hydrolase